MSISRAWTFAAVWAVCLCWSSLLIAAQTPITDPIEVVALQVIGIRLIDPNENLSNWAQGDPCTSNWTGVICFDTILNDGYLHVQHLQLLNLNLSGTLSPELGLLSHLRILDFMWNNIIGSIPKEIGNITFLELLLLNGNQLTGPLPDELGYLQNLGRIQIDQNQISGPIPKSFANLSNAKYFLMNNNSISGQIPPELSRLPNLFYFLLDNNNLSGYLPPELSEMPSLRILQLDNNLFDGTRIPASYSNMSKLLKLSLRNCSLQGQIPDLSRIRNLGYLDLSSNKLNGSIPPNRLSESITTIYLSNNNLMGSIPENFLGLPRLQRLLIANNNLSGSIIWQNRTLNGNESFILDLQNNMLSNISGSFNNLPPNVTVWLNGNPLCSNANFVQFCGSQEDENDTYIPTNPSPYCVPQSCPYPFEYSPTTSVPCFCAAPLVIGYRLKSPGFSDFRPYQTMFENYLTLNLNLYLDQLYIEKYVWQKGPRLRMYLKLFPKVAHIFNGSEVQRIISRFTEWIIPDSDIFGPYELLDLTLLEPYLIEGQCQNNNEGKFQCAYAKGDGGDGILRLKLGVGISVAGIAIIVVLCCCFWRIFPLNKSMVFWKKNTRKYADVEAFIRNYGFLTPKRYSYSSIKKITNSLQDKLGQGGYGSVYKGKLQDGKVVAVKVLNNPKSNGEEFINEVASISRTSHVNVVSLLGFCFEGSKRALIYEFMSNGSLEKFIYKNNSSISDRQLGWRSLYQISLGIARGLEYLHRGCITRIVHFDIKPHNILLDEDFCPKISDFGLAKLCPRKDSIISMTGARGTAGYIAPEVFCRNFGNVSHKSDVYSYGMMVLEMVGGRKNIDVGVDRTSEIYFPHWIYNRLELHDELELQGITNEEDKEFARKMIIVSLWCIQTDPSNRPPINEVVDMLEGSLESLQIPPKPFLSSPSRSPPGSSTTNGIITL